MPTLRIALAQVNVTVGDLTGNAEIVVDWTRRAAARGARVVVFPEMALTGYPVEDLALRASFVEASIATLRDVAERLNVEGLGGVAVVLGYLDRKTGLAPRTGVPAGAPLASSGHRRRVDRVPCHTLRRTPSARACRGFLRPCAWRERCISFPARAAPC